MATQHAIRPESEPNSAAAPVDEILTVPELGARIKLRKSTIYSYVERGLLTKEDGLIPGSGATRIYWPKFLDRYLAGHCGFQMTSRRGKRKQGD